MEIQEEPHPTSWHNGRCLYIFGRQCHEVAHGTEYAVIPKIFSEFRRHFRREIVSEIKCMLRSMDGLVDFARLIEHRTILLPQRDPMVSAVENNNSKSVHLFDIVQRNSYCGDTVFDVHSRSRSHEDGRLRIKNGYNTLSLKRGFKRILKR